MDSSPRTLLLELLLDLAHDASSYLRCHARRGVRISAALLVAASMAACGGPSSFPVFGGQGTSAVQPLSQEVRSGLPGRPGRYPIVPGSLARDGQGVYHFSWRSPDSLGSGGSGGAASVSRARLGQADQDALEVPAQGDPILYLRSDSSIPLVGAGGGGSGGFATWHPFYGGGYFGPRYYDPPTGAVAQGGQLNGARVSAAPAAPSSRTVGLPHTVSGRAGGSGAGSAASTKSGAGTDTSSGKGIGSARSSGFSDGSGGAGGKASS